VKLIVQALAVIALGVIPSFVRAQFSVEDEAKREAIIRQFRARLPEVRINTREEARELFGRMAGEWELLMGIANGSEATMGKVYTFKIDDSALAIWDLGRAVTRKNVFRFKEDEQHIERFSYLVRIHPLLAQMELRDRSYRRIYFDQRFAVAHEYPDEEDPGFFIPGRRMIFESADSIILHKGGVDPGGMRLGRIQP